MRNIISKKRNKRGETLIETVISLAVFALSMLAVGTLIAVSFRMADASGEAFARLGEAAARVEGGQTVGGRQGRLVYRFGAEDESVRAEQNIVVYEEDGLVFFAPE